jgi:hypothetical protein
MVVEGEMEFDVERRVCHLAVGEGLLILAGAADAARNVGMITARWLCGHRRRG